MPETSRSTRSTSEEDNLIKKVVEKVLSLQLFVNSLVEKLKLEFQEEINIQSVEKLKLEFQEEINIQSGKIKHLEEKLGECITKTKYIQETQTYKNEIKHLQKKLEESDKEVKNAQNALEQYTRRNSLRIFGIPENKNENTSDIMFCTEKLNLDVPTTAIDYCHRLFAKEGQQKPIIVKFISRYTKKLVYSKEGQQKPIIVKFISRYTKKLVYSKKKMLKGSKVVIKEDLTRANQNLLKEASKRFGDRKAWSFEGKIYVKSGDRIKTVKSISDLEID
ncbi:hypothetical protein QE152_g1943 [Popillia japonica]|uniref:Uncharacterized protein n=1 Tax=Popillia japonica TaxID=7064 RepID=A0AAW1N147_POPJA